MPFGTQIQTLYQVHCLQDQGSFLLTLLAVKSPVHAITIKLDAHDGNWSNVMYDQFIRWIQGHKVQANISRSVIYTWFSRAQC